MVHSSRRFCRGRATSGRVHPSLQAVPSAPSSVDMARCGPSIDLTIIGTAIAIAIAKVEEERPTVCAAAPCRRPWLDV